jgi:FGFR1 oncogene partner
MDFSNKSGAEGSRSAESCPMLLDVLEGYRKYEVYLSLDHHHITEARIIFLFL